MKSQLSVVTIAVGKTYYLNLAKNLLRSFLLWNKGNGIHFLLVTDNSNYFNSFQNEQNVTVKQISLSETEKSFTSKFLLFDHVVADANLFIDCDCIIYGNLLPIFEQFKHQDFSVVGENITEGDFFGNVASIIQNFKLSYLPYFVGSIYYFKKNEVSRSIFEMAKALKNNYDQLGFIRLRGKENEEPLFAVAMAHYQQQPIMDDGTVKADAMFFDRFDCNVQKGRAILRKNEPVSRQLPYAKPTIVHYNDRYTELEVYLSEQYRLDSKLPAMLRDWTVAVKYLLPAFLINNAKKMFRPLYHQFFGPSKIKTIKRLDAKTTIYLFYEEPDPDRWFKFDRYPRQIIRRIIRGKTKPGGVMMIALELMKGLDQLKIPYRFNDYRYVKKHPEQLIGVIGKPQLIFEKKFKNPILFGAGIYSHPIDCPDLFERYPNVQKILVPGPWIENMFKPYYGDKVTSWPVGIDTDKWQPNTDDPKKIDFLIYDKVRWKHDEFEKLLIQPIKNRLDASGYRYQLLKYGSYKPIDLQEKLKASKAVIFLCEHETQGIAYQQILSTNTPILAWDRGGFWEDPSYFPELVKYEGVSSVPYWDQRCGLKFANAEQFEQKLPIFMQKLNVGAFSPRAYILENLTLEMCAKKYLEIMQEVHENLTDR